MSCKNKRDKLEVSLVLAKDNKNELEKILKHYSINPKDSLKYRAACFLIENMPGHYSFSDTTFLKQYLGELDSIAAINKKTGYESRESAYKQVLSKYDIDGLPIVQDIEYMSAAFLINNIDEAFDAWEKYDWLNHLTFDDFCEYILPYKVVEGQVLDDWRNYCAIVDNHALNNLKYCSSYRYNANEACNIINENLRQEVYPRIQTTSHTPITRISTLRTIPFGTCDEYAVLALAVLRANGIPCAIDYTPQWPFRSMGHTWNVLLERTGRTALFEGANTPAGTPHKKDHKMAKVYRKTYAANKELKALYASEKYIPETFEMPFIKDVTDEYMITQDVVVDLFNKKESGYAYLAVFDNANWIPIAWGKINNKRVQFEKVGKDIVYLPIKQTATGIRAIANPLLLTVHGETLELRPDTTRRQTMKLYRKYPMLRNAYWENGRKMSSKIQAAHFPDFRDSVTVYEYTDLRNEVQLDNPGKYRYWRHYSSPFGYSNVAELAFFERDSVQFAQGEIIGTKGSFRKDGAYAKEAVFDRDLLTFFDAPVPSGAWVGMDFGKPVDIAGVTCIMRGDGNEIEPGDKYELVFWNEGQWQSLGKQVANDFYLIYDNCPTNALFLLHNLTKGKEERIFTYENGEQIWW